MKKCKEILIGVLLLSMVFFTACTSKAAKAMEKVEVFDRAELYGSCSILYRSYWS